MNVRFREKRTSSYRFRSEHISPHKAHFHPGQSAHHGRMLTRLYIEALLADEKAADAVWEAWDSGEISDFVAAWVWWAIVEPCFAD